jgi:hemerythrin-like domain-containing protein
LSTAIACRPRLAANAAKSTSGRVWDSAKLGAPSIARISQVTWFRSSLCRIAMTSRPGRLRLLAVCWVGPHTTEAHGPVRLKAGLMSSDAIVLLKADHKQVRRLFREFETSGDRAVKKKARVVSQILEMLTVHTYVENQVMYPGVLALLPDLEEDVLESYEEHHVADLLCLELSVMAADDERFTAKTTVLIENVSHHIEEEEQEWFPKVRAGLSRKQLQELGVRLEEARKKAPRKPAQPSALKKTVSAVIS